MTFYSNVEQIIKQNGERGLISLEFYSALDLDIFRETKESIYSKVHGPNSGKEGEHYASFKGVLVGDDFFPSSGRYSGSFVSGFCYTRYKDLKEGDTIKVKSDDSKIRRYRVEKVENIGFTTEIFTKWKISSIGD